MVDLSQAGGYCGGYTTELEYVLGPVYDSTLSFGADLSHYSQVTLDATTQALKGVIDNF